MNRIAFASLIAATLLSAAPASAVTNENGEVLITQAAVNAGNITPGDTPGFPVTISVPGTYRLATNLTVTTQVNGIEVRANEVTIEMGGRTLAGSGVGRNGITSFNRTTRIRDGVVRGFSNDGVRTIAQFLSIVDLVITANGRNGVYAEMADKFFGSDNVSYASISKSKVVGNMSAGIICGLHCSVDGSVVSFNGGTGISFNGFGGMALGNAVIANEGWGMTFTFSGGAGNNTVLDNASGQINGAIHMQPNACSPACPPPP
jgi:hypothetical protein